MTTISTPDVGTEQPAPGTAATRREGFHTVTPYLISGETGLVAWIQRVFDAEETFRSVGSAGGSHVEVRLGDSMLMIGDGGPGGESFPAMLYVYVDDVDATYARALEAGATSAEEPADQPHGERHAGVRDPFGNVWYVAAAVATS